MLVVDDEERILASLKRSLRMLITGWSEAVSDEQIEALDIRAVIPKPWEDADLKNTLRKALG